MTEVAWTGATAAGAAKPAAAIGAAAFPVKTDLGAVTFVASPTGHLPDEALWERTLATWTRMAW